MPAYMLQLSYSAEILAAFIKKPQDRKAAITKLAEQSGMKLVGAWLSLGDYDAVVIVEGGDNVSAAAVSMAVTSSGVFNAFKTTPLLTPEEGIEAMKKAGKLSYKPPTKK